MALGPNFTPCLETAMRTGSGLNLSDFVSVVQSSSSWLHIGQPTSGRNYLTSAQELKAMQPSEKVEGKRVECITQLAGAAVKNCETKEKFLAGAAVHSIVDIFNRC